MAARGRRGFISILIIVLVTLMLLLPMLVQGFNNPLLNTGQLAQTFQHGFGGTAQTTLVGTLISTPMATQSS